MKIILSVNDKSRFKILYMEYSHRQLAKVFNTDERNIVILAKELGVFVNDYEKGIKLNYIDKEPSRD